MEYSAYNSHFIYNTNNVKQKVSKSAYMIALINKSTFLSYNANYCNDTDIYYIVKDYDGSFCHETCALIGIPIKYWTDLTIPDSEIVNRIRNCRDLNYIDCLHLLNISYVNEAIYRFRKIFKEIIYCFNPDDLILFNIEPKGYGKLYQKYPVPRLCIPGGTMENQDENSFIKCGFREFKEETGFNIEFACNIIDEEKIMKYKTKSYNKFKQQCGKICMYYLIRLTMGSSMGNSPHTRNV